MHMLSQWEKLRLAQSRTSSSSSIVSFSIHHCLVQTHWTREGGMIGFQVSIKHNCWDFDISHSWLVFFGVQQNIQLAAVCFVCCNAHAISEMYLHNERNFVLKTNVSNWLSRRREHDDTSSSIFVFLAIYGRVPSITSDGMLLDGWRCFDRWTDFIATCSLSSRIGFCSLVWFILFCWFSSLFSFILVAAAASSSFQKQFLV